MKTRWKEELNIARTPEVTTTDTTKKKSKHTSGRIQAVGPWVFYFYPDAKVIAAHARSPQVLGCGVNAHWRNSALEPSILPDPSSKPTQSSRQVSAYCSTQVVTQFIYPGSSRMFLFTVSFLSSPGWATHTVCFPSLLLFETGLSLNKTLSKQLLCSTLRHYQIA